MSVSRQVCVCWVEVCLQSQQSLVTSRLILITAHIERHTMGTYYVHTYTYIPFYVHI